MNARRLRVYPRRDAAGAPAASLTLFPRAWLAALALLLAARTAAAADPAPPAPAGFVVMSYNILHSLNPLPPSNWGNRRPLVWQVIRAHRPDVLALQEVLAGQLDDFEHEFGRDYSFVGHGHSGPRSGEILPIAWRRDRFELVAHQFFWLSPTPHLAGSKGWGGRFARVVTGVRLRERATGRELLVFNNHWEADNDLMEARRESARLLLRRTEGLPHRLPVLLVGDFNVVPTRQRRREPYRMLVEAGERKDWVLFRGALVPRRTAVDDFHRDSIYPSDHLPVIVEFDFDPR